MQVIFIARSLLMSNYIIVLSRSCYLYACIYQLLVYYVTDVQPHCTVLGACLSHTDRPDMHCVHLALWTRKVLCGSFLCAIYKFSFIHSYNRTGLTGRKTPTYYFHTETSAISTQFHNNNNTKCIPSFPFLSRTPKLPVGFPAVSRIPNCP